MEQAMLQKVHTVQMALLREVARVCRENEIQWFLCCGTLLGAVRHQGFIPWDDDVDIGMLRQDYEKFCRLAPSKMDSRFCVQSWYTEPEYPLPFAKVRMRNTLYVEEKSAVFQENGFYVDVFPFDNGPDGEQEQINHGKKLNDLFRRKLMKSGYRPWIEQDRVNWVKRIGYLPYVWMARRDTQQALAQQYDALAVSLPEGHLVCRQRGLRHLECYPREWFQETVPHSFEGEQFPVPVHYHDILTAQFGDYMTPPPKEKRENRHQIIQVDFGDGTEIWRAP